MFLLLRYCDFYTERMVVWWSLAVIVWKAVGSDIRLAYTRVYV